MGIMPLITGDPLNQGVGYLTILDIDDKKGPDGLYKIFKDLDTLQVKTASKGFSHVSFGVQNRFMMQIILENCLIWK